MEYAIQAWWRFLLWNDTWRYRQGCVFGGGTRYKGKLKKLNMATLQDRRRRGDMIEVWKILKGYENVKLDTFFKIVNEFSARTTRLSDSMMSAKPIAILEIRKNFFSHRVIDHWNCSKWDGFSFREPQPVTISISNNKRIIALNEPLQMSQLGLA